MGNTEVKMCANCNRLVTADTTKCPECGCEKFEVVELFRGTEDEQ